MNLFPLKKLFMMPFVFHSCFHTIYRVTFAACLFVHSIHLANFSGKLDNYNTSAVCLLVVIQICKLAHFLTHVRFLCVRFSFCVSVSVLKLHLFIVFNRLLLKKKSWKEQATEIIVNRGDRLWKPANIKVENNGAVGYVRSSLTVHNPLFFFYKLLLYKLMRRFYWLLCSKW